MKLKTIVIIVLTLSIAFTMSVGAQTKRPRTQSVTIRVSATNFSPENAHLRRGIPTRITFLRTTDATCAKEIIIPSYSISRSLPLNQPVTVTLTPRRTGHVTFACGMDMMRGTLLIR